MVKLIALYRKPDNIEAFDNHYLQVHIPLVRKMPGLRRLEVTRITGAPIGDTKYHTMAEMYFDDQDSLNTGAASPEGKAATKDLMGFAANLVTMFYGETKD